jgi:hypothetical protein
VRPTIYTHNLTCGAINQNTYDVGPFLIPNS